MPSDNVIAARISILPRVGTRQPNWLNLTFYLSVYPCYCQSGVHGSDHSPEHRWIRSRNCVPRHSIISGPVPLHVGGSSCKYNAPIPCRWRQRDDRSNGPSAGSPGGREKDYRKRSPVIIFSEGCPSPSQAGCRVSRCLQYGR